MEGIPLLQAVSASKADIFHHRTSPINPEKPQYNELSTMCTLKWWETYLKKVIIEILGSFGWFFRERQAKSLFQYVID